MTDRKHFDCSVHNRPAFDGIGRLAVKLTAVSGVFPVFFIAFLALLSNLVAIINPVRVPAVPMDHKCQYMAKILFTAVVADMRNSINGTTFSKNRYGAFARTKVTPVNPQTTFQQAARQALGNFSSAWRGLTDSQRQSWIDGAPNFPFTDIFGNQKILSGQALYVALNTNLLNAGQSAITTCPVPVGISPFTVTGLTATVTGTVLDIAVSAATVPAGFTALIYATPLITAGRNFVKNRFRFIGTAAAVASVIDAYALWNARFGTLTAGMKVFVEVVIVSNTTGQMSVPSSAVAIVGA